MAIKTRKKKKTKAKAETKKDNPLYVVTNNGKDVEEAKGPCDMIIKRLGLEPAIKVLSSLLDLLFAQIKSYAAFVAVKEFIDKIVAQLEGVAKRVAPFMFYYRV